MSFRASLTTGRRSEESSCIFGRDMNFVYPAFLFGLFAVSIPIIVHLFNFRRFKKIYFTNVKFLREIKQDTRNRSRLKHLLILAARILAIIFLVLAFAQPYIPVSGTKVSAGVKRVSVYIDNSFSMDAISSNGDLLEVAKKKAREIASGYQPSDLFQLLTNDFEGRSQRLVNREEFLRHVDAVKPGSGSRPVSEILARQRDALQSGGSGNAGSYRVSYLLSDFQKSMTDLQEIKPDSSMLSYLIPITASKNSNVFIDTCYFTQPFLQLNSPNELLVRIRNSGNEPVENVPVSLSLDEVQRSVTSVNVEAGSSSETKLSFTMKDGGWKAAEVNITDYPVVFDDHYYLSFRVRENLNVLTINQDNPSVYIDALFAGDDYYRLKNSNVSQVDYSSFHSQQLIILNGIKTISSGFAEELKKYISQGGSVTVFPSADPDFSSWQNFLSSCRSSYFTGLITAGEKVMKFESAHPLLQHVFEEKKSLPENMDLPSVHKYFALSRSVSQSILTLGSGNSLLSTNDFGKGHLYLFSVPLSEEFSSLPRHALFVPVMLKSALRASSEILPPLIIGRDQVIEIKDTLLSGDNVFHLKNEKLKFDIVPESRVVENSMAVAVHDQVKKAGTYRLNSGNKLISLTSFNYDRKESDLSCYAPNDLTDLISKTNTGSLHLIEPAKADLGHTISQLSEGRQLWKYCIIAVLFFLAAEIIFIRFMNG